ncbi:MAG: HopJ type III effector protein [Methylococcales bacterium]|nr:HopJ type III effector protein [Methylococcales bacterium]
MTLTAFLDRIKNQQAVSFSDTMAIIATYYHYSPSEFSNGLGDEKITNATGTNEGSCKLFYFAQLQQLSPAHTLSLFGDYYQDVLKKPDNTDHMNIRTFIKFGWDGIEFQNNVLRKQ